MTAAGPRGPDATLGDAPADATAVLSTSPVAASQPDGADDKPRPGSRKRRKPPHRVALEWVILIAVALAIAFLIKTLLFQAFYIPSGSMEPTLNIGDRVLVNKLSYDLHDVNRGDIVVFETPTNGKAPTETKDLVKRVIGLPGETVTYADGGVLIDDRPLKEPYIFPGATTEAKTEEVPPGCDPPASGEPGCVVPKGQVFVLGDNRENSTDGRVFGTIDQSTIVGRVFVRIWPLDDLGFL